ncbi:universal stress protein [Streptomyces sp. MS19]|uniref:universal stress protein n=1 Tax=Streptomyces sp. MS19 TaxID=3385972 RepID=UPI0039A0806B
MTATVRAGRRRAEAWRGFAGTPWRSRIGVRDFIQADHTPYKGDEAFLAGPTERTLAVWDKVSALFPEKRRKGVLDVDPRTPSTLTSDRPGYEESTTMNADRVVAGVDGSPASMRALDRAADEAVRRAAALRVVYTVPDLDEAAPILAVSAARVHARHPGLPVTTMAVRGSAVRALVRESGHAALTVVGTRGLGGLTGLLLGSVSLRLAAHVRGPLLVVRGDHTSGDGGEVLLGLAGEADEEVAACAFREAEWRGAGLRVLHFRDQRPVHAYLSRRVSRVRPGAATAEEPVPRERHPAAGTGQAHALLEATRAAGLVVIGAHHRARRLGPHLGPVAHTLLHRSHCPVLVVPTG